jgi:hypothetical protein
MKKLICVAVMFAMAMVGTAFAEESPKPGIVSYSSLPDPVASDAEPGVVNYSRSQVEWMLKEAYEQGFRDGGICGVDELMRVTKSKGASHIDQEHISGCLASGWKRFDNQNPEN